MNNKRLLYLQMYIESNERDNVVDARGHNKQFPAALAVTEFKNAFINQITQGRMAGRPIKEQLGIMWKEVIVMCIRIFRGICP
jgi:hypothetical protein